MRLKADVDLRRIAADAHGFVGADISQLCLEAALQCVREQLKHIDFDKDHVEPEVQNVGGRGCVCTPSNRLG